MCRAYVWDVVHAPFPSEHIYYNFYNLKRVQKILPDLVPEFHRIAFDHYYDVFDVPDICRSMYIMSLADQLKALDTPMTYSEMRERFG